MKIRRLFYGVLVIGVLVVLLLVSIPVSVTLEANSTTSASDVRTAEYSWEHLATLPAQVYDFDSDPFGADVLYAALSNGLYRSVDGGSSWSVFAFEDRYVSAIAVHPQDSSVLYVGAQKSVDEPGSSYKVYRLSGGESAPLLESGSYIKQIFVDRARPRILYVAIGSKIHRSYDGGNSWAVGDSTHYLYDFAVSPSDPMRIYAAAGTCGLYKSDDGGQTWTGGRSSCDPFTTKVTSVDVDPFGESAVYSQKGGGPTFGSCLFRWTGEGSSETLHTQCMGEDVIFNPHVQGELFFAGGGSDGRRFVKRSLSAGEEGSWILFEEGLPSSWPGPYVSKFFIHNAAPCLYAQSGFYDLYRAQVGEIPVVNQPVIIVPGLAASWHWRVLFDDPLPGYDWQWTFPGYPIAQESWIPLTNALKAAGYEEDRDYFVAFYDWRKDNNWQNEDGKVPREYLMETIDEARQAFEQQYPDLPPSAFKVNIVAHSLGGIVTRSYVESPDYRGDVAQVILLGSPHDGVVDAYYAWEGGKVSPRWSAIQRLAMGAYLFCMEARHIEPGPYEAIHNHAKVMHNLLPVGYDYLLKQDGAPIGWETMAEVNDFLAYTASSDSAAAVFSSKGVSLTTIAGTNLDTWEKLVVDTEHGESPPLWLDGKPVSTLSSGGDGTVLASSVLIPGADQVELPNVWHVDLPRATNTILQILGIEETVSLAGAVTAESANQEILAVFAGLTVDVELRDEAGNLVGNYTTDPSGDFKIIVAPDLAPGSYELRILGEELLGDYCVSVEFYGLGISAQEELEGQTTAGEVKSYTLHYDPDAPDPLQLGSFDLYLPIILRGY